ncbi:MAG: hypothetical protein CMI09_02375 [Oceanospirillaceae bacterium]|nr:hypothetical protein [Oceanospirillaceae bacterium]
MSDYKVTIPSSLNREDTYKAITEHMSDWWTPMSARFLATGDRAKTDFGVKSYWVFEAITLDAPNLIELKCVESHMVSDQLDDPEEWKGTVLKFEVGDQSLTFTHIGLTPTMACYSICEPGWNHYLLTSLKQFLSASRLADAKGQPTTLER